MSDYILASRSWEKSWSFYDIYILSKKYDDLGHISMYDMGGIMVDLLYDRIDVEERSDRIRICKGIWSSLKIAIVSKGNFEGVKFQLDSLEMVLSTCSQMINVEFRECKDVELLNLPDPDENQKYLIERLKNSLSIMHYSERRKLNEYKIL